MRLDNESVARGAGGEHRAASDTGNHYASSEHLRDHIVGAEFALVSGCGHGLFWQKPQEVNKIIRDWLDRH